jgi:hypothetical protein
VERARRLTQVSQDPELVRWLWYGAAYLLIVDGLALLARVV